MKFPSVAGAKVDEQDKHEPHQTRRCHKNQTYSYVRVLSFVVYNFSAIRTAESLNLSKNHDTHKHAMENHGHPPPSIANRT